MHTSMSWIHFEGQSSLHLLISNAMTFPRTCEATRPNREASQPVAMMALYSNLPEDIQQVDMIVARDAYHYFKGGSRSTTNNCPTGGAAGCSVTGRPAEAGFGLGQLHSKNLPPISRFADSFPFRTADISPIVVLFSTQLNIAGQLLWTTGNTAFKMSMSSPWRCSLAFSSDEYVVPS